jgi:FMN-dependent NADH-azoreductase
MLLLRAQECQLSGAVETAMANLLVINSSAARESSVSRILVEEAVPRPMCEQWIKKNKGASKWTRLAANKIQEHKTATMAQGQQSPASGALLGELQVGVCKTTGS